MQIGSVPEMWELTYGKQREKKLQPLKPMEPLQVATMVMMESRTSVFMQMSNLSLTTADWLTSPAALPFLETASAALNAGRTLVQLTQTLRKELSAEQAHAVLEQVDLRRRGEEKFAAAARMLFTRTSLQQATDEIISRYKAERFPATSPVEDLCCGIGGDLLGLAERSACVAVDRDSAILRLAEYNLSVSGNNQPCCYLAAEVRPELVTEVAAWHLDPDRRPTGERTIRLENFSPSLEMIDDLRQANPCGALKLAPASEIPADWEADVEREWISRGGECRQQVVWCDRLAKTPGMCRATVLDGKSHSPRSLVGKQNQPLAVAGELDSYLFEPDPAILAAKLTSALAEELKLQALTSGCAYLTGSERQPDPAVAMFIIRDAMPFDRKRLKSYFRARDVGQLEIKKRGVQLEPAEVRRSLGLKGTAAATLIIAPFREQILAIIAERVGSH